MTIAAANGSGWVPAAIGWGKIGGLLAGLGILAAYGYAWMARDDGPDDPEGDDPEAPVSGWGR